MLKCTDEKHPEFETLKKAYNNICELADAVNEKMREDEKRRKLVEIRNNITGWPKDFDLVTPNRIFIMEGELVLGKNSQRHVYLFSDLIVMSKKVKSYLKYRAHVALNVSLMIQNLAV